MSMVAHKFMASLLTIFVVMFCFLETANAELLGRLPATPGGTDYQAYYDTEADLTWLADANYAQTSGFDSDGNLPVIKRRVRSCRRWQL